MKVSSQFFISSGCAENDHHVLKLNRIVKCEIFNEHDEVHGQNRFQIKDKDCLVTSTVAESGVSR